MEKPSWPDESTGRGYIATQRRSTHGVFDAPVTPTVDQIAERAATRWSSPRWSPVAVAAVGVAALSIILIIVGEIVTRGPLLDGFRSWDQSVSAWFSTRRTSGWSTLSSYGSHLAETAPIIIGALVLEAVLMLRRRWRDLLLVLVGLSVEITVFLTVNELVRRPRPPVHRLGIEPSTFSFPSGHIAATVVLYGSMAVLISLTYRKRLLTIGVWCIVALLALTVGFARVYRGMHHVSDVVAGALMGLACLGIAAVAARASALAADHRRSGGAGHDTRDADAPPRPTSSPRSIPVTATAAKP
jgi:membrane-associated phospholipid phosphatase